MKLNQFYTEKNYSEVLVQNLSIRSPEAALDLGFGTGNLLSAARNRWRKLNLIGIDIDARNVKHAHPTIKAFEHNGFDPNLPDLIIEKFGSIDLLISNPPYFSKELNINSKKILKHSGLLECITSSTKRVPAELIFLAQNLRLLSQKGELGIILPAGLISGQRWKPIREYLFSKYHISNVIQLPVNSFKKTDAQTFILIIKNRNKEQKNIPLSHINECSRINATIHDAVNRADYNFHAKEVTLDSKKLLQEGDFELLRGNRSHNILCNSAVKHLHTTDMPKKPQYITLVESAKSGLKNVKPGDILIARVGRRCVGRLLKVKAGSLPISDCIIAIRPKTKRMGQKIWKKLNSNDFNQYLESSLLGVSAKYITYNTIKDYLITPYEETK